MTIDVDQDKPRLFTEVGISFKRPSATQIRKVKEILGSELIRLEKWGPRTEVSIAPPQLPMSLRDMTALLQARFGHLKSYNGCDMTYSSDDGETQKEAA